MAALWRVSIGSGAGRLLPAIVTCAGANAVWDDVAQRLFFGTSAPAGVSLEANAAAEATASGDLGFLVSLAGDGFAEVSVLGNLDRLQLLAGDAQAQSSASGALNEVALGGNAAGESLLVGTLALAGDVSLPSGLRPPTAVAPASTLPIQPGWRWNWFARVALPEIDPGAISLEGAAGGVATAGGGLAVGMSLAGDAGAVAVGAGDIEVSVLLASAAEGEATASADLYREGGEIEMTDLTGDAKAVGTATGTLSSATPLQGGAGAEAAAAGDAVAKTPLTGAAQDVASASGTTQTQTGLAGAAQDVATASGSMQAQTGLAGAAQDAASASGSVQTQIGLAGTAAAQVTASGAPSVGIRLDALAQTAGSASGSLTAALALAGLGAGVAEAGGGLAVGDPDRATLTYAINLNTGAVTQFKNCSFDRLVRAHGVLYGLKDGNVYRFGGDQDPNSTPINASVRFAPQGFETGMKKRLIDTYLFSRIPGALRVLPIYDETEQLAYSSLGYEMDGLINHKVKVGKGNAFHTLGLVVENTDGGTFDVGALRLNVQTLSRRI